MFSYRIESCECRGRDDLQGVRGVLLWAAICSAVWVVVLLLLI